MKVNPAKYANLIGKKYVTAKLLLTDPNNQEQRVANIKDAELIYDIQEVTQIIIQEQKNNWCEKAVFDNNETAYYTNEEDKLFEAEAIFGKLYVTYTYYDNQYDYYGPDWAFLRKEYQGETEEELRKLLENKVKEVMRETTIKKREKINKIQNKINELETFMN